MGLAVSSAILANVLKGSLPERLSSIADSTFAVPNLSDYSAADAEIIVNAYADASRAVFIFCCPVAGIAFLLTSFIKDRGLVRKEEKEAALAENQAESSKEDVEKGEPAVEEQAANNEVADMNASIDDHSRKPSLSSQRSGRSEKSEKVV